MREKYPFNFSRFRGWFAGIEKKALALGDYSVAGLEDILCRGAKGSSRPTVIHSCTIHRRGFFKRLRLMARYPYRLSVITSPLSQVKSPMLTRALTRTGRRNFSLPSCKCLSCAARHKNWARNSWARICTRCTYTTGWSRRLRPVSYGRRSLKLEWRDQMTCIAACFSFPERDVIFA